MDRPRPLRLEEVRDFEYVEFDPKRLRRLRINNSRNDWGTQTPLATCVRCGRNMSDPNRDIGGGRLHENPEDDREPVCFDCLWKNYTDARKVAIEEIIDERLDLNEKDRESLKKVVELVVTEPDKVLELKDLGNRVRDLEKQTGRFWVVLGLAGAMLAVLVGAVVTLALAS